MPWLIWATYNPFPKISEDKMENRSKHATVLKFMRPRVLNLILYLVFRYFRKWKTRDHVKFYAIACLGSWYILNSFHSCWKWFCKMTLNRKSAAAYFLWSSKFKGISSKIFLVNFLSGKLVLSCSVWIKYPYASTSKFKYEFSESIPSSIVTLSSSQLFSNVYLFIHLIF